MPKIRTNKSAAKRFHKTATGKIRRRKAYANHILTKKTSKRKRNLRKATNVHTTDLKRVRKMIQA